MVGVRGTTVSKLPKKSKLTSFRPMIFSRHPSHKHLRTDLPLMPFRSIIRFGSTNSPTDGKERLQINSVQSVRNSASKLLMKECFTRANVKTADWTHSNQGSAITTWARERYPIIAKPIHGSRGNGISLLKSEAELATWLRSRNCGDYIIEKYYNYNREYRLHVTRNGCFYTCRKMLKSDVPENKRHIRNDSTCSWFMENNPQFNRPANWDTIVAECVKALNAVGLDIGGFDVRVQSETDKKERARKTCDFIIIESNSACSHGDVTAVKYREELTRLLKQKHNQ